MALTPFSVVNTKVGGQEGADTTGRKDCVCQGNFEWEDRGVQGNASIPFLITIVCVMSNRNKQMISCVNLSQNCRNLPQHNICLACGA